MTRVKVVVGDVVQDPFITVLLRPLSADVTGAAFLLVPPSPFDRNSSARQLGSWDPWTF